MISIHEIIEQKKKSAQHYSVKFNNNCETFWVLTNNKKAIITNSATDAGRRCDNGYHIVSSYTNGKETIY